MTDPTPPQTAPDPALLAAHRADRRRKLTLGLAVVVGLLTLQAAAVGLFLNLDAEREAATTRWMPDLTPHTTPQTHPQQRPAPPLTLLNQAGTPTQAPTGTPTLVHFWSTRCGPCSADIGPLLRIAEAHPHIRLLAVPIDTSWGQAIVATSSPPSKAIGMPTSPGVLTSWGITGLPETFLVDAQGTVRARLTGPQPWEDPAKQASLLDPIGVKLTPRP